MRKSKSVVALVLCLCLLSVNPIYADTASDLYELYGSEYVTDYPDGTLETISKYQNAKKYVAMYQYVITSDFDPSIINERIDKYSEEIDECSAKLLAGYSMSLEDIFDAEGEYLEATSLLHEAKKSLKQYEIDYSAPEAKDTPSYTEYSNACVVKDVIDAKSELGDVKSVKYPINGACLIDDQTDTSLTLLTAENNLVQSLFNGVVAKTTEDSVTVYHYNHIYTYYGGLTNVTVSKGDTVYQYQTLGTSSSHVTLKLKINGDIVDINKLLHKEEN